MNFGRMSNGYPPSLKRPRLAAVPVEMTEPASGDTPDGFTYGGNHGNSAGTPVWIPQSNGQPVFNYSDASSYSNFNFKSTTDVAVDSAKFGIFHQRRDSRHVSEPKRRRRDSKRRRRYRNGPPLPGWSPDVMAVGDVLRRFADTTSMHGKWSFHVLRYLRL